MKRLILTLALIALAAPAFAQLEPLCTPVPAERENELLHATYSVAQTRWAALVADPSNAAKQRSAQLAALIIRDPGQRWRVLVAMRQSTAANCSVNWSALTYAQIVTQLDGVWQTAADMLYLPVEASP